MNATLERLKGLGLAPKPDHRAPGQAEVQPLPRQIAAQPLSAIPSRPKPAPSGNNLLGAKGVGESGTLAAPAAVVNALLDALRPLGVRDLAMPVTPERVWQAIRDARARQIMST